jgi:alanine dehydrogenase
LTKRYLILQLILYKKYFSFMTSIAIPREIKDNESRVGGTTATVSELKKHGHTIYVEKNAGLAIGITDEMYKMAGATILETAAEIYAKGDVILKVKEPQASEIKMLKKGQAIFSYLHLAPDKEQTAGLVASGCHAIAFETVTANDGTLPLLAPMSEVAGKISTQKIAQYLEKVNGGSGILLGGVPGTKRGKITIIGGGFSGYNAAIVALGMGAEVTILDKSLKKIRELDAIFQGKATILYASTENVEKSVMEADGLVGAVLIPGAAAPKVVSRALIAKMKPGSVAVDIAIDQGGCFETSKPTSHSKPVYVEEGVTHYCVTNMPGNLARTSSFALENATLPFTIEIANKGFVKALKENIHLRNGLNVAEGKVTYKAVAENLGYEFTDPISILG